MKRSGNAAVDLVSFCWILEHFERPRNVAAVLTLQWHREGEQRGAGFGAESFCQGNQVDISGEGPVASWKDANFRSKARA